MELAKLNNTGMTSLKLVEQINIFRKEEDNKSELAHSDLLKIIREEFDEEIAEGNISCGSYKDKNNQDRPMFDLTLSQAKQVLVRESKIVRKAVIKYIEELENKLNNQFAVPKTYREALLLAAAQQEEIEKLQLTIETDKPKVEFYEAVTESNDTIDMGTVAKVLNVKGVGRNTLFEILRKNKVLMSNNSPFQSYIDKGWFRQIETKFTKPTGDIAINIKTVVFQKGVEGIRKIVIAEVE